MRVTFALCQFAALGSLSSAFLPVFPRTARTVSRILPVDIKRYSSQWADEEDEESLVKKSRTSFDEAGDVLREAKADSMGDYDANPSVSYCEPVLLAARRGCLPVVFHPF